MRRVASLFFASWACVTFGAACVSPPEVRGLPRIEARFGEPAPTPKKPEATAAPVPKEKEAEKTVDPPPHRTRDFVKFSLQFESGRVRWLASERIRLAEETAAARRFGRFALVALKDGVLIERVHFDFPLLAKTSSGSDTLERGLTTKTQVLFPDLEGTAELFLIDDKTGAREPVPWRSAPEPGAASDPKPSSEEAPSNAPGAEPDPSVAPESTEPGQKR